MKTLFLSVLFIACFISCNKDDDRGPVDPIDLLPPATQTGANTFGCLLDGKAFLPGATPNPLDCFYQFVNGEYYFAVQCSKRNKHYDLIEIGVGTFHKELSENQTFDLLEYTPMNASGSYFFNTFLTYTSQYHTGELYISKLDDENSIVSGTFWFDVMDDDGIVHHIREGRFDMLYSK